MNQAAETLAALKLQKKKLKSDTDEELKVPERKLIFIILYIWYLNKFPNYRSSEYRRITKTLRGHSAPVKIPTWIDSGSFSFSQNDNDWRIWWFANRYQVFILQLINKYSNLTIYFLYRKSKAEGATWRILQKDWATRAKKFWSLLWK